MPVSVTPMMASSDVSTRDASCRCVASAALWSVTSRIWTIAYGGAPEPGDTGEPSTWATRAAPSARWNRASNSQPARAPPRSPSMAAATARSGRSKNPARVWARRSSGPLPTSAHIASLAWKNRPARSGSARTSTVGVGARSKTSSTSSAVPLGALPFPALDTLALSQRAPKLCTARVPRVPHCPTGAGRTRPWPYDQPAKGLGVPIALAPRNADPSPFPKGVALGLYYFAPPSDDFFADSANSLRRAPVSNRGGGPPESQPRLADREALPRRRSPRPVRPRQAPRSAQR